MSTRTPLTVNCPTCQTAVAWIPENAERPFCSERCKLIDLGAWASESYRIPVQRSDGLLLDDEADEFADAEQP